MDTLPINIENKCREHLLKLNNDSKYLEFNECKKIVNIDKKNFESISNNIVGSKCADYFKKTLKENKPITKKDLMENCESFKKIAEKTKKGGRRGGGKGGRIPPLPKVEKKEEKVDKDLWKELFKDLGDALKGDDIYKEILKALKKFVGEYCISIAQTTASDLKKVGNDAISGINKLMRFVRNGISGVSGWDEEGFTLSPEIYNVMTSLGQCLLAVAGLVIVWKVGNYFRKDDNPKKKGNKPDGDDFDGNDDDDDDKPDKQVRTRQRSQTAPTQTATRQPTTQTTTQPTGTLTGSASQVPLTAEGNVDMLRAYMINQAKQQSKDKATATYNQLAKDIQNSVIHDEGQLNKTGWIKTPLGIMSVKKWNEKQEDLKLKEKRDNFMEYEKKAKELSRKYMADNEAVARHNQMEETKARDDPTYNKNLKPAPKSNDYAIKKPEGYTKNFEDILTKEKSAWEAQKKASEIMKQSGIWNKTPIWELKNPKTGYKPDEYNTKHFKSVNSQKEKRIAELNDLKPLRPYQPKYTKEEFQKIYDNNPTLQNKGSLGEVFDKYNKASNDIQSNNDKYINLMTKENIYVKKPQVVNKPSMFVQKEIEEEGQPIQPTTKPIIPKPITPKFTPEERLDVSVEPITTEAIHKDMFIGPKYNPAQEDLKRLKDRLDQQKLDQGDRPEERKANLNSIVGKVMTGVGLVLGGVALRKTAEYFSSRKKQQDIEIEADPFVPQDLPDIADIADKYRHLKGEDRTHLFDFWKTNRKEQEGILNSLMRPEVELKPQALVEQQDVLEQDLQKDEHDIKVGEAVMGQAVDIVSPEPIIDIDVGNSLQNEEQQDIDKMKKDMAEAKFEIEHAKLEEEEEKMRGLTLEEDVKQEGMRALTDAERRQQEEGEKGWDEYGKKEWEKALGFGGDRPLNLGQLRDRYQEIGLPQHLVNELIDEWKLENEIKKDAYAFRSGSKAKLGKSLLNEFKEAKKRYT